MKRKIPLEDAQIYHIFNRSIAGYEIFHGEQDYERILKYLKYYQIDEPPVKFSDFAEIKEVKYEGFYNYFNAIAKDQGHLVQIITYCIMPTHIHLILKQLKPNGISNFTRKTLVSYSRYFNTKYHRKGPLWESKFQNVLIETDEQLIHLTRYLHLNAVTAGLVDLPQEWQYSSYNEYLGEATLKFCEFNDLLSIKPPNYKKFVEDNIDYQKKLNIIKKQILE